MKKLIMSFLFSTFVLLVYGNGQKYNGQYIYTENDKACSEAYTNGSYKKTVRFWFKSPESIRQAPTVHILVTDDEGRVVAKKWVTLKKSMSIFSAYLDFEVFHAGCYRLELLPESE